MRNEGTLSNSVAQDRATVLLRSHIYIANGTYFHLSSLTWNIHEQWLLCCALVTQPNLMLAISLQWMKYSKSIGYIMRTSGPFQDSSKRYSMTHTLLKSPVQSAMPKWTSKNFHLIRDQGPHMIQVPLT